MTTMSVARANLLALAWLPLAGALVLVPFALVWGIAPLRAGIVRLSSIAVLVPALFASIVLHETLHAVGFLLFGRVPRRAVRLGLRRQALTPYAACAVPVTAAAYRGAALLPALVLGVGPALVGLALGAGWVALWAFLMLGLAGGDLAAVWAIRHLPGGVRVVDHPTRVGASLS